MEIKEKKCPKCGVLYAGNLLDYFYTNRSRSGGLAWKCKPCSREETNSISRRRRDKARYEKNKQKPLARSIAQKHFAGQTFKCSVIGCLNDDIELHHVNYDEPLAVVPLCRIHHKMNHDL